MANHDQADYWVVKLSSVGIIEWQKALGGSNSDIAFDIQQTTDEGFIVVGYTQSSDGDVTGILAGTSDYWIVKLTSVGTIEWQKMIGGIRSGWAKSVQQTSDGGYIVAGESILAGGVINDALIVKLSDIGAIVWQKRMGGNSGASAQSIRQTLDGGYIIAGSSTSTDGDFAGNHGNSDYWVAKLSSTLSSSTFLTQDLKGYPNPTTSIITLLNSSNLIITKIIITDLSGKIIIEKLQNSNQINVEKLARGVYILQVFSKDEKFISKFVKE
jgi:hypothetical protein